MSRTLCQHCQRPTRACICTFIIAINNTIPVIVLQHPNEVKHSKGTVALLAKSLKRCQVIVGENFNDNVELSQVLSQYHALLLYPSEQAEVLSFSSAIKRNQAKAQQRAKTQQKERCLILLDGTWKKAYRMFMLSEKLQALPQVCLPEKLANSGQYLIRKVAKANALSSLEACCYALTLLESHESESDESYNKNDSKSKEQNRGESIELSRYQPLLNKFAQFNQFQLLFRQNQNR